MTHLRMIFAITMVVSSIVAMTNGANAASPNDSSKATVSNKVKTKAGQTDIIANGDMPMVTNILPWQEKQESIPKNILELSALKDSLTPTDRDRLAGEIRYTSILNQPVDQK